MFLPPAIPAAQGGATTSTPRRKASGAVQARSSTGRATSTVGAAGFEELQQFLAANNNGTAPATIGSVAITKGRDYSWQGAVDGLRINDTVYDFEENGVVEQAA